MLNPRAVFPEALPVNPPSAFDPTPTLNEPVLTAPKTSNPIAVLSVALVCAFPASIPTIVFLSAELKVPVVV